MATGKGRSVEFAIRARDEFSKVIKNLEREQKRVLSAAEKTSARRNFVGTAEKDVADARSEYTRLIGTMERYQAALDNGRRSGKLDADAQRELAESISLARQRANEAAGAYGNAQAKLTGLTAAGRSGFAAFIQKTTATRADTLATNQQASAAAGAAAQLKVLDTAANKVAASQRGAGAAIDKTTASIKQQNRASVGSGAKGEAQDTVMWGLKPWQLTNLGYQANDVVSGLVMGQAPLQIFAQQAGQIAQIWPNVMVSLAKGLPVIAKVGVVLAPVIAGFVELTSMNNAVTEFSRRLTLLGNGANYSAQELAKITKNFGEIEPLLRAGFSEASLKGFYTLAKTLSNANGKPVAENVADLAKAFAGGVEGVRNLDRELNFLSATQLRQIREMEAQGDTAGALRVAQNALSDTYKAFASNATGPWSRALENFGKAWQNLTKWMASTLIIRVITGTLDKMGDALDYIAEKAKEVTEALGPYNAGRATGNHVAALEAEIARVENWQKNSGSLPPGYDQTMFDNLKAELEDVKRLNQEIVKAEQEAADAIPREAEMVAAVVKLIDDKIMAMEEETRLAKLSERARFQELEIIKLKNEAIEKGLKLSAEEIERLREAAGIAFDGQQNSGISSNVIDKIIGVESGGNASAKNPNSSATGLGQFISSTWLRMFKQYFPERAKGMTDEAIKELRKDAQLSRAMTELYVAENKKTLERFGVAINDASLYLAHFLGAGGARSVLTADANTPVSQLLGADQISANQSILGGKTAGQVIAWAQQKMKITDEEVAANARLVEIDKDRADKLTEYNEAYAKRIEQQRFDLDLATQSARQAAIAKAVRAEELEAEKAGLALTAERRDEVEKLAAAAFDNANAETKVNELLERRSLLMESLTLAQQSGNAEGAAQIIQQIQGTETELNAAIESAIAFYQAMGGPAADAAILKLENLRAGVGKVVADMETKYLPKAEELNEQLADAGGGAFSAFAQAIATGENAWEAFKNAMLQGLADIVIAIGQAIVKQALLNALTGGGANPSGGIGGMIGGFITGLFHEGGMIGGQASGYKTVNPAIFAGAQRYHGGGMIENLKSNEVPIIAEVGEEMLTRSDPRHSANGGGGARVKNVNVFTAEDVLEQALQSEAGERVIINWMTRNSNKINGALA